MFLFITVFVLISFGIPLSLEIYKNGRDNLVTKVGTEIRESKPVAHFTKRFDLAKQVLAKVSSTVVTATTLVLVVILLCVVWRVLEFLFGLFR